ncbi:Dimodular nonribosomal peptide synthase [Nocardia seriolae]|uniref:Dimodular nonribosomal peptide synthase n=1 Tax=Nocardia seriolae TaxID=37332 RepID=A0ABC8AY16_9NOCA|nr:non-ribosomal peptide synthetase [Nocardia seriolae]APA98899.1 Dimodular nonribosomal peptide synthase [Nocardia seriolae]BEK95666.1 non-ribosomal peptide synthetase [Nocardia seriolae]GAM47494.1 peptide synthetase [Nocardia seriolae]GAP29356.1 non-ribosomal peptide synthetase [Nocardia seriolae]GEM25024.1 non-ribosomal peptide synthetase [Nocardia seriolae NBRC 15557]
MTRADDGGTAVCTDLPLSTAQLRWWVAQQLFPAVPNTVAMYLEITGSLERELLQERGARAARELESPLLRFRLAEGYPRQYRDPDAFRPAPFVDLTDRADPLAAAVELMDRDHATPLDLLEDPLTVATVYRLGPQWHLLYLRSHHIVLDGLGAAALLRRTTELYSATLDSNTSAHVDPVFLTVADMLDDERAYLTSTRARGDREYWSLELAGMGEPARLAGPPAAPAPRPHRVAAEVPEAVAARLRELRQDPGIAFPEVTIAAFACYLAGMTGAEEIVLSLPVPARPTAALRRSAGTVSNVVPLRLSGIRAATGAEVIERVRAKVVGALRHQRYRYEDMLRDSGENLTVRGSFGPVVNMLQFVEQPRVGPLSAEVRLLSLGPVEDLLVNGYQLGPDERTITIDMQANPELYSRETLAWHHGRFLEYLERFLTEPQRQVPGIELPPARPAESSAGTYRLLPDLLRTGLVRASGDPGAVALQDGARALTYRELDELSSRWARVLIESGVGPGDFVLVAVPRSAESVLAVWAVAKSGAAFVPVDPTDPARRLQTVAADSGARVGITVSSVHADLPDGPIWLELDDPRLGAPVAQRSAAPIVDGDRTGRLRAEHPAYLIYTSGTTGTAKGVVVTHRGLGSLTDYIVEHYGVDADSRVLHAHAPSFDAHLLELLAAFAAGARLVVEPPGVVAGPDLAKLLNATRITHFLTTPAVLATLSPTEVPTLRVAVVGGETCPSDLVRRWSPTLRLCNGYGPTETTVMATQSDALAPGRPVTIGPPLPGVRALVLDARLHPVPPGGPGELYLGGPGVAQGYLHRPGPTAERFIADPFGSGERIYRTGDLVSAEVEGSLEFLGRADDQLAVRGRRVEAGEIAAALLTLPEIAQAVVTAEDAPTGVRLIGYVVAAPDVRLDTTALVRRLRTLLPAALVPAQLVELERLPITAHGKVDRAALPPPPAVHRPYRAPEGEWQRLVAEQFAAATETEQVGLDDDFFELGGNSLLGVAVSAELSAATGVPVTVRWLYTAPTVAELAQRLSDHDGHTATDDALGAVLTLRRNGSRTPLFCVHSAFPLAWCYAGLARYVRDRPVFGLQALTPAGDPQAARSIDELAAGYVEEMLTVQPEGPYHLLGWSLGGQIAHAIAVRLRARGAQVTTLAMLDSIVFPDDMPPPPSPRMRDLLTHLLGDEPEDADQLPEVTADQAAAELATAAASFGTGLTAEQLTRLHRGYVDGVLLSARYRPAVFDGDLLYFSATRGMTESLDAGLWRPYVTGALVEHPVAATHAQLTNADVVAVIGPILAAHLDREGSE